MAAVSPEEQAFAAAKAEGGDYVVCPHCAEGPVVGDAMFPRNAVPCNGPADMRCVCGALRVDYDPQAGLSDPDAAAQPSD